MVFSVPDHHGARAPYTLAAHTLGQPSTQGGTKKTLWVLGIVWYWGTPSQYHPIPNTRMFFFFFRPPSAMNFNSIQPKKCICGAQMFMKCYRTICNDNGAFYFQLMIYQI